MFWVYPAGVTPEQAVRDWERLQELMQRWQLEDAGEMEGMLEKYLKARSPGEREKASVAYRIQLVLLDRQGCENLFNGTERPPNFPLL